MNWYELILKTGTIFQMKFVGKVWGKILFEQQFEASVREIFYSMKWKKYKDYRLSIYFYRLKQIT